MATYPWPVVLYLPIYTTLRMAWLFCSPAKSSPTDWVIYGLIGQQLSSLIVSQACQTLSMNPQEIWDWWQHIHGLWFQVTTHATMLVAWWFFISCQIWSHSLGALWLGWMASQRIDCVAGLSDFIHVPTRHV